VFAICLIISNVLPATTAVVFVHRPPRHYRFDEHDTLQSAGSRLWNSLPHVVTSAPTLAVFRNQLKTYLFCLSLTLWLLLIYHLVA